MSQLLKGLAIGSSAANSLEQRLMSSVPRFTARIPKPSPAREQQAKPTMKSRAAAARIQHRQMMSKADLEFEAARESMSNWQHHQWVKAGRKKGLAKKFATLERTN